MSAFAFCVLMGSVVAFWAMRSVNKTPVSVTPVYAANCNTRDNMDETAQSFIGRCCKGSINSVFPSDYLDKTLSQIQDSCKVGSRRDCDDGDEPSLESARRARTAWKLLNRDEYRK